MYGVRLTRFFITLLCAFAFYQTDASFGAGITALSSRGSFMVGVIVAALFCEIQSARAAKGAFAQRLLNIDEWAQQVYRRSMWLRVIVKGFCFLLLYQGLQLPWALSTSTSFLKQLVMDGVVILTFGLLTEFLLPKAEQN